MYYLYYIHIKTIIIYFIINILIINNVIIVLIYSILCIGNSINIKNVIIP